MERSKSLQLAFLAAVCLAVQLPPAHAAIVITDDVIPADANDWDIGTYCYVGKTADGELEVNGGSGLESYCGYIGFEDSVTGHVTVDGADSMWTNSETLYVGREGSGTLNIIGGAAVSSRYGHIGSSSGSTGVVMVDGAGSTWTNSVNLLAGVSGSGTLNISGGAAVSVDGSTYVAYKTGSTGLIRFGAGGGTLTTGSLVALPAQLVGTGTINTRGLVSDIDLVFDSTASLTQNLVFDSQPDQNVTVHFDLAGNSSSNGTLGAGWKGHGSLTIRDGITVDSDRGYIGYHSGSTGVVTVDGTGSKWTSSSDFWDGIHVGYYGSGTLNITGGASVSASGRGFIGHFSGSTGVVTVDGSTWNIGDELYVGLHDRGTLIITGDAEVSAGPTYVARKAGSTGLIHFGTGGGTLTCTSLLASLTQLTGTGTINTRGLVSDVDLVFDSTASLGQTLVLDSQPEQNITVHLDLAGNPSGNGDLGAGWQGHGSLAIRDDVVVDSDGGFIGYHGDSTGAVTVDGTGSRWTNRSELHIGYYGSGTLHITGGAAVSNTNGSIGRFSVVTVDGAGSTWTNDGHLRVGGTLDITNGATVSNSSYCYIGTHVDSTNVVTVDGVDSAWINTGHLLVGYPASGTLHITGGAKVSNTLCRIGLFFGFTSSVIVDGVDSTWINTGELYVGRHGIGTLHIIGGGSVLATNVSINRYSLLAIDVGNGSLLQIGGGGEIDNGREVRILAGAGAVAGNVYEPIAASDFSGDGAYQAIGGTWDEMGHQFTASDVVSSTSGAMLTIDRSLTQRLLIDDGQTGWSVGASFLAADVASDLNLTATAVSGSMLGELASLLEAGDSVRGAWMFEVTGGYSEGDPAFLSFDLGPGFDRSDVNLWHYDGSQWIEYLAADLTYNGDYASFTVTGFSGYAVSAVPEPGTLALLAAAALALAAWTRRRPKG